jgi:nucleoside-diphosphate-sugar epimerase
MPINKSTNFVLWFVSDVDDVIRSPLVLFSQVHSLGEPKKVDPLKSHGEVVEGELDNVEALHKACDGVHTVIHLAGQPSANATWDQLREPNING